jgi:hypothetical protein
MIEIDDGVGSPHSLLKFVSTDDLTCSFDKAGQYPERLALQLDLAARLPKLSRLQIGLKYPKTYLRDCIAVRRHDVALKPKSSM